jgi:hypothetical protein
MIEELMAVVILGLIYGVSGMFFLLASVAAIGAIIYPFYIIFNND